MINHPVIDSALTLKEALSGVSAPENLLSALELAEVNYFSFDGKIHRGQLVVHRSLMPEIQKIFTYLSEKKFPVAKAVPICRYGWDDERSMNDNNTSAFNYRKIYLTSRLSEHSYGWAIDINPLFNPYVARDGSVWPRGAWHDALKPGTILAEGPVVEIFEKFGWEWGGRWRDRKDWQHFQKPLI